MLAALLALALCADPLVLVDGEKKFTQAADKVEVAPLKAAHGEHFVWFQHQGATYVVKDGATLDRAAELLAPQQKIDAQLQKLGDEQSRLGAQQAQLRSQQGALVRSGSGDSATVPTTLGERQRKLAERRNQLSRQQEQLTQQRDRAAQEVAPALTALLEQAIAQGRAQRLGPSAK